MGDAHIRVGVAAVVADGERLLVLRRSGAHGTGTVTAGEARIAEPAKATDLA